METLTLFTENYEMISAMTDAVITSFSDNRQDVAMAGFGDMQNYLVVVGGYVSAMVFGKAYMHFKNELR